MLMSSSETAITLIVLVLHAGVHPAYLKGAGSKKNSILHSGTDSENVGGGGGDEILK